MLLFHYTGRALGQCECEVAAQAKRPHTATVALAYRAHGAACSFFVGSPAILRYAFPELRLVPLRYALP